MRIDSGVEQGSKITVYYDPMIAKLCVHGADRAAALSKMKGALAAYEISGIKTNLAFHRLAMENAVFASGDYSTAFISEHKPSLTPAKPTKQPVDRAVAAETLTVAGAVPGPPGSLVLAPEPTSRKRVQRTLLNRKSPYGGSRKCRNEKQRKSRRRDGGEKAGDKRSGDKSAGGK